MNRLSHTEYLTWYEYYRVEPFGALREDFRFGQVCATMANSMRQEGEALVATDFIQTYDSIKELEQKETVVEMNNSINNSFAALKQHSVQAKRLK